MNIWMNSIMQESRGKMEEKKGKDIYSYILRFNREFERDRQALDKIMQFCEVTGMTMRDVILLILSVVDISALQKNICSFSLNVTAEEQAMEKGNEKKAGGKPNDKPVYEKWQEEETEKNLEEKEEEEKEDLFSNPEFKRIFSNF